jgi:hypothetical protein
MKYALPICAVAALLAAAPVVAADAPAKEESPWTVTSNIALTNAYFFRGLNYTRERPAVQGGFDISHSSGFYVGTWASNVASDAFPDANVEIDVYGGYAKQFGDFLVDAGVLQFIYPGGKNANTTELYIGTTWKWFNVKYSHSVTDYFGYTAVNGSLSAVERADGSFIVGPGGDTKGSGYIEFNANYEVLPSWVVNGHVGHQNVNNLSSCSYTDYRGGVTKNFDGGWQLSAAGIAIDTVQGKGCFFDFAPAATAKSTMDLHYQVMLKRVF